MSPGETARVLVEALPYIRQFAGKSIVVKLGGAAIDRESDLALAQDVLLLRSVGVRCVLVHGGGPQVDVMLRSTAEMKRVVARNPFPEMAETDPGHLVVVFLPGAPDDAGKASLKAPWSGPETLKLIGADLYITYPEGIGVSKLKLRLKPPGTARNWRVVTALADLVAAEG